MAKHRTLKTSKLFYKKWPYKIECWGRNFWMVKRFPIKTVIDYCQTRATSDMTAYWDYKRINAEEKVRLLGFAQSVGPFLDKDLQIRVEGNHYNIYCKDTDLYNDLVKELGPYIVELHEPDSTAELDYLNDNGHKKVLCNKLPFRKFKYRVHFNPNCNRSIKTQFESWLNNYSTKVKMPRGTIYWLNVGWYQSPYIYVEDNSTLAMIGLYMGNDVKKVEEFIPRSSINISLDQDNSCHL